MPTIKYMVIKQGCMTILTPFRFSPAALWPILVQNNGIQGQYRPKQQYALISVKLML